MTRTRVSLALSILAAGLPLLTGATLPASAQSPCALTQITQGTRGDSGSPSISGDGRRIAFASTADLTPQGVADGRIFLVDVATRALTPVTPLRGFADDPSINGDGTLVAFESFLDLVGFNADHNSEVFLYDDRDHAFYQVSQTVSPSHGLAWNGDVALCADGNTMVYSGVEFGALRADVVIPGHNSPFGVGINPAISGDGRWVAFESWMDLTGGNPDGDWEVFLWDSQLGILSQISDGGGGSPALDGDGSRVAFVSNGDLAPGENPDRSAEVFVYDVPARRYIQVTHTAGVGLGAPAIDAAGSRIAFSSSGDLVPGRNPQHVYQIFLFDVDLRAIRQVTAIAAGAGAGALSLSADGSRIAFQSRGDLIPGSNPEGNSEIFLATCPAAELSLHGGRFRVSAEWRLPGQAAVRATGVKLSELAGYFWFFHPDNPELFVKVLDACPQNFWVFCAGLTDVEVGLRVVDTESGEERVWTSVGGRPFPTIQDTLHFRVCDE